jgi:hypothetical protein
VRVQLVNRLQLLGQPLLRVGEREDVVRRLVPALKEGVLTEDLEAVTELRLDGVHRVLRELGTNWPVLVADVPCDHGAHRRQEAVERVEVQRGEPAPQPCQLVRMDERLAQGQQILLPVAPAHRQPRARPGVELEHRHVLFISPAVGS